MGNISWTKSWSASDNGTVLGGADIQNIQNDITTVVNGGITNANVNGSAAIVESKLAFDTSAGHDHDGTDSKLISATNTHFLKGSELVYSTAATFYANPGIIELNGVIYSRTAVSTTMNLATAGHWVSGSEGAGMWVYVYAYNDSGTSWDLKISDEAPAYYDCDTGNSAGTLRYRDYSDVWYRCIGAVRNDGSSNILKFYQNGDWVNYDALQTVIVDGTATSFTDADCTGVVPGISEVILVGDNTTTVGNSGHYTAVRPNGSADAVGKRTSAGTENHAGTTTINSVSQIIEYMMDSRGTGGAVCDINVHGYNIGAIR